MKKPDAEKERDRLARQREKQKFAISSKVERLLEQVNRLMGEAEEELIEIKKGN